MKHELFGEISFSMGWKTKKTIRLSNNEFNVILKIKAYFEDDGIASEQEKSYEEFLDNEMVILKKIDELLEKNNYAIKERIIPKTLLISRDGSIALLCDDKEEPDEGIAVCIMPEMKIVSQDDYL